jgi:hypothetical protein
MLGMLHPTAPPKMLIVTEILETPQKEPITDFNFPGMYQIIEKPEKRSVGKFYAVFLH